MPVEVSQGFEYLLGKYGQKSLNPVGDQHEAALREMEQEMEGW